MVDPQVCQRNKKKKLKKTGRNEKNQIKDNKIWQKEKKIEDDMAHIRRVSAPRTTCTTRGWQNPIFIKNDVSETGRKIGNFHNFETTMGVPQLCWIGPCRN
jgi:hypothetical protein